MPESENLNLKHIQAELRRLDLLIWRQVRRWQKAEQNPDDILMNAWIAQPEKVAPTELPLGGNWGQLILSDEADEETFATAIAEATEQVREIIQAAHEAGQVTQLDYLQWAFQLDSFEIAALLVCAAPMLDIRYGRFYDSLQDADKRQRATVNLVLNLLGPSDATRLDYMAYFGAEGKLIKHHLLSVWEPQPTLDLSILNQWLMPDKTVLAFLLGQYEPRPELAGFIDLSRPSQSEADHLLALPCQNNPDINPHTMLEYQAILAFYGPDQESQKAAARHLASQTNQLLMMIELGSIIQNNLTPKLAIQIALRDARLTRAIPCFLGWDACLDDDGAPSYLLRELVTHPNLIMLCGEKRWRAQGIEQQDLVRQRPFFWLEAKPPTYRQRLPLWQMFVEQVAPEAAINVQRLAAQFSLATGQIRDAVASARDQALQNNEALHINHLFAAARIHSRPKLTDLAHQIIPRYDWDDIILPPRQREILQELVNTIRERAKVLEEWGVGEKLVPSAAVTTLFAGPPGTGKTMAAEVIAKDLGFDLYKIDLSNVVSKYIGETEKNLEKIFQEAENSNTILFFDEADAIFGKRSEVKDAHDRHANIEVSYLLQRMETFDGVTILATNLQANLDEAFLRRLQFVLTIPFPDEASRLHIWETLFPPNVPQEPDLDFAFFADRFKLAGGHIRNIIVSATYLAASDGGRVTMDHLLHSTRRELQKMGRLVNEADLQPVRK
ncbi:MAG: ATP-binding protein [Chloroflexota bacterium]